MLILITRRVSPAIKGCTKFDACLGIWENINFNCGIRWKRRLCFGVIVNIRNYFRKLLTVSHHWRRRRNNTRKSWCVQWSMLHLSYTNNRLGLRVFVHVCTEFCVPACVFVFAWTIELENYIETFVDNKQQTFAFSLKVKTRLATWLFVNRTGASTVSQPKRLATKRVAFLSAQCPGSLTAKVHICL